MNLQILDPQNPRWVATLKQIPHDVYHCLEYIQLEAQRLCMIPEAFLIEEGDNVFFLPYLLRSCRDIGVASTRTDNLFDITSPYGYSGFLLSESAVHDTTGFMDRVLARLKAACRDRGICAIFLRLHPIFNQNIASVWPADIYMEHGKTVSIDLTLSKAKIWAHTRRGHQSGINKCKRLGLQARMVPYEAYINTFIDIYEEPMHRVHAQPEYYFDRTYFTQLAKLGAAVHLCIVEFEQQIVATSILFESGEVVQAHLGGTRTQYLKQSAFMALVDYVRLWAKARGNKYFHLGGGIGGKQDSLYNFKSGFSQQRHQFHTIHLVTDQVHYDQLVQNRCATLDIQVERLLESGFFPAYRTVI